MTSSVKKLRLGNEGEATCPNCDKEFSCQKTLDAHSSLFCTTSVTDVNKDNVVASLMIPEDSSKCVFCSVVLASRAELAEHAATHLRCHICALSSRHNFRGLSDMRRHFEGKHGFIPCLWCHLIFNSKDSLCLHFCSKHQEEGDLQYPKEPLPQILEATLSNKSLKLSSIFRAIETTHPYLYIMERTGEWKKEVIYELYSNPRYGNSLYDKTRPDTLFYLESTEEIVLVGSDDVEPSHPTKAEESSGFPNHILQLVYEDEELDEKDESRLALNEAEEDIRRQEWFLKKARKPWRVFGMCSLCGRLFADNQSLSQHIGNTSCGECCPVSKDEDPLKGVKCLFCKSSFESFVQLVGHVLGRDCKSSSSDERLVCHYCPAFCLKDEMRDHYISKHMERNEKKTPLCKLCGKLCASQNELRSHFLACHIGDLWTCLVCQEQFLSLRAYEKHVSGVHPIYSLNDEQGNSCFVCQISFSSLEDRDLHLKTTTDHPVCWVCSVPCGSWKDLIHHFELNLEDHSAFYCRDCRKLFHKGKFKRLHVQLQHSKGLKDALEKQTIIFNISLLSRSVVNHENDLSIQGERKACKACSEETLARFQCSVCDYPVHSLQELHAHMEKVKHKDLSCVVCLRLFLTPFELKAHYYECPSHIPRHTALLVTSDEENPNEESEDYPSNELVSLTPNLALACSRCESTVIQNRSDLLVHALNFHPDIFKNIVCRSCNTQFTSKKLLRVHSETCCRKTPLLC